MGKLITLFKKITPGVKIILNLKRFDIFRTSFLTINENFINIAEAGYVVASTRDPRFKSHQFHTQCHYNCWPLEVQQELSLTALTVVIQFCLFDKNSCRFNPLPQIYWISQYGSRNRSISNKYLISMPDSAWPYPVL